MATCMRPAQTLDQGLMLFLHQDCLSSMWLSAPVGLPQGWWFAALVCQAAVWMSCVQHSLCSVSMHSKHYRSNRPHDVFQSIFSSALLIQPESSQLPASPPPPSLESPPACISQCPVFGPPSQGTYFLVADVSSWLRPGEDDVGLCKRLTVEAGVTLIPISAFYASDQRPHHLVR